jgi:RimJ/RimL family protein N-acetyltransferase
MASRRWVEPVVLAGSVARLEPLSLDHLPALINVGLEAEIWRWMPRQVNSPADMRAYIEAALSAFAAGTEMPFATIEQASGLAVGSTRYMAIEPRHRRLEIGNTWLAPAWQRTAINTEAKLLMLGHAFNVLGALRVEFKTDALNELSRAALVGIGAREEGTLRWHMLTESGRRRDSVYFSIIEEEWPQVRMRLQQRLARLQAPPAAGTAVRAADEV